MALLDERSIIVQPSLVRCLGGMHQAAVLQQIHFHLQDGEEAALSRSQLSEEIGLSSDQIKRATSKLRDLGVLAARQGGGWDRTNGWWIDRERLQELLDAAGSAAPAIGRNRPLDRAESPNPLGGIAQCSFPTKRVREVEKTRDDRARSVTTWEAQFDRIWDGYPRKLARKAALDAYVARRRAGVSDEDLTAAVEGYAAHCAWEGREAKFILYGATFFGPKQRWVDWIGWTPPADQPRHGSGSRAEDRLRSNLAVIEASR